MSILKVNSRSIDQESGEIWTAQANLQQICPKSDRLLMGAAPLIQSICEALRIG